MGWWTEQTRSEQQRRRRRGDEEEAYLDGEEADPVHSTTTRTKRTEEDEGRRRPPPRVLARNKVRRRVRPDLGPRNGGKPVGEERRLAGHHTSTHRRSLTGFGGQAMETKEGSSPRVALGIRYYRTEPNRIIGSSVLRFLEKSVPIGSSKKSVPTKFGFG